MNFALRLQNKATLTALITAIVAFVYQAIGILGIVAPISEDQLIQAVGFFINVLVIVGVVVDPTTPGIGDSLTALGRENIEESRDDDLEILNAKHAKVD